MKLIHANIVYSKDREHMAVREDSYIGVDGGDVFGKTGAFDTGCAFDALVIDDMSDAARNLTPLQSAERFCYIGTKENIRARYIDGELIG